MDAAFNEVAGAYDTSFTDTFTGREQRNAVWDYLRKNITASNLKILEINCGTGEDALFLASMGHYVYATDASQKMIDVAVKKTDVKKYSDKISFAVCSFDNLHGITGKYDLIFSNFGGLNCLSPEDLKNLSHTLSALLTEKGRLIAVVMPPFCAWEFFYFSCKLHFKKGLRRLGHQPVIITLEGKDVPTWYHSASSMKNCLHASLKFYKSNAIGIAIPPSYLEPLVNRFQFLKPVLAKLEKWLGKFSWAGYASDHLLLDFHKK